MATAVTPQQPAATGRKAPKKARLIDRILNWRFPDRARGVVTWISIVLLLVAFALLVWGMVSAVSYTLTHTGPPCTNPPQREAYPPQLVVVGVCLLFFVLGHLTARWQYVDPKHAQHHQNLREAEHPETDPRKRDGLIIQTLLLVFLIEVIGLLIIEAVTLSQNVWPITYYVRCAYDAAGVQSMAAAASILFLVGRWFWLPDRGQNARTRS
jgi:TRAP-type C4-dicarboxylate transport system permease small subunit